MKESMTDPGLLDPGRGAIGDVSMLESQSRRKSFVQSQCRYEIEYTLTAALFPVQGQSPEGYFWTRPWVLFFTLSTQKCHALNSKNRYAARSPVQKQYPAGFL